MRFAAAMFVTLMVAGAATGQEMTPAPSPGFSITNDKFEPEITVVSPARSFNRRGSYVVTTRFRSYLDKISHLAKHQIYVDNVYDAPNWRFYNAVYDDRARAHALISIARSVAGCSGGTCVYSETFAATISDDEMREYGKGGVEFKIIANDGSSYVIALDASDINSQLAELNKFDPNRYDVKLAELPVLPLGLKFLDY